MTSHDPLPVLLLRRGKLLDSALAPLLEDPRFAVFSTSDLTPAWISLGRRLTGLVVATDGDPIGAFGYAITACVRTPIVILAPRKFASHRGELLEAGAAACLSLPLRRNDLDRVLPLLKRHETPARVEGTLRLLLDPLTREARLGAKGVRLTQREYALLHHLSARHGRAVAAEDLLHGVWGDREAPKGRGILDVYVFQLRKKLEALGIADSVSTVRGFGYALGDLSHGQGTAATANLGN